MRKSDIIGWTIIIVLSIYFLSVSWYEQNKNDSGGDQYERIK